MSIIATSNFASDLLPLVKNWYGEVIAMPMYYDKMVKVEATDRNYHVEAIRDSLGVMLRKNEGSALTYDSSKKQQSKPEKSLLPICLIMRSQQQL
jgi:hypothetical protein